MPSEKNPEFVITRVFDAPREAVFDAWTDPAQLPLWMSPVGSAVIHARMDLRPGGVYHYGLRYPDGATLWAKWTFREIARPHRLVFVLSFSDETGADRPAPFDGDWPHGILTTLVLEAHGDTTALTLASTPLDATEAQRRTFAEAIGSMHEGWGGTLGQLDTHLAG